MDTKSKSPDTLTQWITKPTHTPNRQPLHITIMDHLSHFVAESMFCMFEMSQSLLLCTLQLYIYYIVSSNMPLASESRIQSNVAFFLTLHKFISNMPSIFFALCCGSWSDHVGIRLPVGLLRFVE